MTSDNKAAVDGVDGVDAFFALIIVSIIFLLIGAAACRDVVNDSWEQYLVDNPEGVAAIRSRVIAERAEREVR